MSACMALKLIIVNETRGTNPVKQNKYPSIPEQPGSLIAGRRIACGEEIGEEEEVVKVHASRVLISTTMGDTARDCAGRVL